MAQTFNFAAAFYGSAQDALHMTRKWLAKVPYVLWILARRRMEISRQRRHLASLDDRLLSDIGVDRLTAEKEAARPASDDPYGYRFTGLMARSQYPGGKI